MLSAKLTTQISSFGFQGSVSLRHFQFPADDHRQCEAATVVNRTETDMTVSDKTSHISIGTCLAARAGTEKSPRAICTCMGFQCRQCCAQTVTVGLVSAHGGHGAARSQPPCRAVPVQWEE